MTAPDPETLRRVLLDHHPVVRSETGPLAGCRCGQVKPGQDVIAHVAAQVAAAYRSAQDGGAEEAVRRVEALAEHMAGSGSSVYRKAAASISAALATQAGDDCPQSGQDSSTCWCCTTR